MPDKVDLCVDILICRLYKMNGSNYYNERLVGPTMGDGENLMVSTSSRQNTFSTK